MNTFSKRALSVVISVLLIGGLTGVAYAQEEISRNDFTPNVEAQAVLDSLNTEFGMDFYIPSSNELRTRSDFVTFRPGTQLITEEIIAQLSPEDIEQMRRELRDTAASVMDTQENLYIEDSFVGVLDDSSGSFDMRTSAPLLIRRQSRSSIGADFRFEGRAIRQSWGGYLWNSVEFTNASLQQSNPRVMFTNNGLPNTQQISWSTAPGLPRGHEVSIRYTGILYTLTLGTFWVPSHYTTSWIIWPAN